jgi:putative oxidoreductase
MFTKYRCRDYEAYLFPIGRALFALIFITAAPRHFTSEGIRHAAERGLPVAELLVPLAGVMALLGGVSLAVGYKARWRAWRLVAFLIPVTLIMHAFWRFNDAYAIHVQQAMFAKNLSMLGAAILVSQSGAGDVSIDWYVSRDRRSTQAPTQVAQ